MPQQVECMVANPTGGKGHGGSPVKVVPYNPRPNKKIVIAVDSKKGTSDTSDIKCCDKFVLFCAWLFGCGFASGLHWILISCYLDKKGKDVRRSCCRVGLFWIFTIVTCVGIYYCFKQYTDCPDEENLSQECFWDDQTWDFQLAFILASVCFTANIWLWIFDAGFIFWLGRKSMKRGNVLPLVFLAFICWYVVWYVWIDWSYDYPWHSILTSSSSDSNSRPEDSNSRPEDSNSRSEDSEEYSNDDMLYTFWIVFLIVGFPPFVLSIFFWSCPCFVKDRSGNQSRSGGGKNVVIPTSSYTRDSSFPQSV